MMDDQRPLVRAAPATVLSWSDGSSRHPGELARTVEVERTYVPDRAAMLMAPPGMEPLDRFERALMFAMHEASDRKEIKEEGWV